MVDYGRLFQQLGPLQNVGQISSIVRSSNEIGDWLRIARRANQVRKVYII